MLLTQLTPYLLYIKIGAIALVVIFLFWLGWHEMSIRSDLKTRTAELALQKATAEQTAKQFNEYIVLQKGIADAISSVKIKSNNYIQGIEVSPPPAADDGDVVVLLRGGALSGVSGFKNNSASRTGSSATRDPGDKTGH